MSHTGGPWCDFRVSTTDWSNDSGECEWSGTGAKAIQGTKCQRDNKLNGPDLDFEKSSPKHDTTIPRISSRGEVKMSKSQKSLPS
jgi:hypothetical protein